MAATAAVAEDVIAPTATEKAVMDTVWTGLNAEPALVDHHRGFLTYVSAHPQLESALESVQPLERHPAFRALLNEFDNSLARDGELDKTFADFYAALAADEPLRDAVDSVYRIELAVPATLRGAFIDLLGDADTSLRFLANPAKPAPVGLYPFKVAFKQTPELRGELLDAVNTLHKMPAAHNTVFPWWQKVSTERDEGCGPYVRLAGELAGHPQRFWTWHGSQIELARDAKARPWILYFQRRVRQDPVLSQSYDVYLDIIRRRPDYAKAALDKWQSDLGQAPAWPPDAEPPVLPVPAAAKDDKSLKRPVRPDVKKPVALMPQMPDMPARPTKPEKPKKPKMKVSSEGNNLLRFQLVVAAHLLPCRPDATQRGTWRRYRQIPVGFGSPANCLGILEPLRVVPRMGRTYLPPTVKILY